MEQLGFSYEKGGDFMPDKEKFFDGQIFQEALAELVKKEEGKKAEVSFPLLLGIYMDRAGMSGMSRAEIADKMAGELDKLGIAYSRKTAIALLSKDKSKQTPHLKRSNFGPGSTGIEKSNPNND